MPEEPTVGKIEFFPNPLPTSPPANDLLKAMQAAPFSGSMMDQVTANRDQALARERRYHLLAAAALMANHGYSLTDAMDRAIWLLDEIERREKENPCPHP